MDPAPRHRPFERMFPWITIAALLALLAAFLFSLPNVISLDDGVRHFAMGRLMAEQGIFGTDGWRTFMYEGTFSSTPMDPWFLADVLYVPFVPFGPVVATKLYTLFCAACLLFSFRQLLSALHASARLQALMLVLLIAGDSLFFFRLLIARPFPLMTAFCLLSVWAIVRERWFALALILCVATLVTQLFIFSFAIACVGAAWAWQARGKRPAVLCVLSSGLGVASGIALHPHPLEYMWYLFLGFSSTLVPFAGSDVNGSELHPGFSSNGIHLIVGLGIVAALLLPVLLRPRPEETGFAALRRTDLMFLLALTVMFFLAFIGKARSIDICWPILLACITRLVTLFPSAPHRSAAVFLEPRISARRFLIVLLLVMAIEYAAMLVVIANANPKKALANFSCVQALPAGSRVLNTDWDLIPPLITVNPHVRYATGMDPEFTRLTDPLVAHRLAELLSARKEEDIAKIDASAWAHDLLRHYPSDILLVSRMGRRGPFLGKLGTVDILKPLCTDKRTVLFTVQN